MKVTNHEWFGAGKWMQVCLIGMVLTGMLLGRMVDAQAVSTTTVQGTVYLANGKTGTGTLVVSWPTFTTASGQLIAADSTTVTIAPDGFVSVSLAPNLGATPAGLYYTVVYYLSDGSTSTEYWVVPAAAQATLGAVQATVMPSAQATQAVDKAYVDEAIAELTGSLLTASGGTLSGPLYLNGDPIVPLQAADKHYVDAEFAQAVPLTGGAVTGELTAEQLGAAYQADQFTGADFGAKVSACVSGLSATNGGICDARNFNGTLAMGSNLTIATANATVLLPCATIATANQIIVTAGTRNVTLRGCALRGASTASGSQGGTVFLYSGAGAMFQVGDPTYAANTMGFHLDNVAINTTASSSSTAQGLVAYRTQEMDVESLYLLGNSNQTGITLDGTGNYTGGTFFDDAFNGFQTAVNAIGHQKANAATTDWMNASTFVRLHIDCPTSGGSPISGTYGINLQQGDGNTFLGGDVEGCNTILHLGANAQNNTIIGLRNENSNSQVVADVGSAYNNWTTGGTMYTGQLTDNGTRNSFLDTFHRSFNGLNGDWYGSQKDATVTNHYRLGTGANNERGLLDRYQTDYGYRWTTGLSDATAGEQFYQILDELNNVYRLSIGQYNNGQPSTNNQTVINSAGTGAVVLNGSTNAGTGGVIIGSGGASETTVATIDKSGNAQFNGTLQVGGATTFAATPMVKNQADAEIDETLWAGLTASQKESFIYKDWNGNSQWYMAKDANNNWALNSAVGGLDSIKAYQSTNSGDTYIDASNATGSVRINYEPGSGSGFDIYGGGSNSPLYASFTGATAIRFPGLAAASGHNCLQIDNSGYITNDGAACGTGSGTVNTGTSGQIAYYNGNGTALAGTGAVPVVTGGTGASTAAGALANLGGMSLTQTAAQTMAGALNLPMLEGTLNADQAQSPAGTGNNGIINSITQCASMAYECSILAPALYSMTEGQPFGGAPLNYYPPILNGPSTAQALGGSSIGYNSLITSGPKPTQPTAMFLDMRYGVPQWIFNQSQPVGNRFMASPTLAMNSVSGPGVGAYGAFANALLLQNMAFGGGRNFYNDKVNLATLSLQTYKYTQTQGGGDLSQYFLCLGNGDCVGHDIETISYGGPNTAADEGNESMRFEAIEGGQVFGANISSITTGSDGSITVATSSQTNNGFVGEGRLLIDLTQKYNAGYISSIAASGGNEIVTCTGCAWDSTFGTSTQTTLSTAVANAGWSNSFPQSNVTLVVASSTGFTAGSLACIWDYDYECEEITAVGTGAVTIATDRLPHPAGAYVTTGGLAGQAIEFEADRVAPGNMNGIVANPDSAVVSTIRNAIPVMYNSSGNQLAIFQSGNNMPGSNTGYTGRAHSAMGSGGSVALTIAGGVVTACTASGGTGYNQSNNPPSITISGSYTTAPAVYAYNQYSAGALNTCVVKNPGAGVTSATATVVPTNPYDIYPAAKVTGVYDIATGAVDGTLYAEPASGTFAAGDAVEQPHYFWQQISGMRNFVGQYIPSIGDAGRYAVNYGLTGVWQGNDAGMALTNWTNPSVYGWYPAGTPWVQGLGQLLAPTGIALNGSFRSHISVNTPPYGSSSQGVITVGCGSLGCANWTQGYNVLAVAGNGGTDGLSYNPSTRAWVLSGNSFSLKTSGGGNVPIVSGSPTTGHLALWGGGTPETLVDGGAPAGSGTALMTGPTSTVANDGACFADANGTLMDCGFAPGTVKSFATPAANWPSWMVPTVTSGSSTPSLSVVVSSIPNSALANAATTVNGQSCALGGSCMVTAAAGTLAGSSLAATVTGSSLTGVGTVTSGTWQGTAIAPAYVSTGTSGANIPLLNGTNTWSASTTTFANGAASSDYLVIKPGSSADQIGALEFANYAGTSQWEVRKDASNTFRIRDTANSLDRLVQYAGGQTVINSGGTAAVAINNTSSAGTGGFTVYEGGTNYNTLAFSVTSSGNASVTGALTANSLTDSSVASAALLGTNSSGSLVGETMSGDATLATSGALTLATVNSSAGSYGSAALIPTVTVNNKGLVTAVTTNAAVAPAMAFTTLTDGATVTLATGGLGVTNATLTLNHSTSTRALNVTGLASGAQFTVVLKQDSTGGAALTLGSGCTWYLGTNAGFAASTTPSLTAAASGINIMSVLYDGTNCYANVR